MLSAFPVARLTIVCALGLILSQESWISVTSVDINTVGLNEPFTVRADHARLAQVYDMDELIAPEHML